MNKGTLLLILICLQPLIMLRAQHGDFSDTDKLIYNLSKSSDSIYESVKYKLDQEDSIYSLKFITDLKGVNLGSTFPLARIRILRLESYTLFKEGNLAEAIVKLKMALETCKENNLARESARTNLELAHIYEQLEFTSEALSTYYLAVDSFTKVQDTSSLGITYYQIGNLLYFMRNHESALESMLKAISFMSNSKDDTSSPNWFFIMSGYNTAGLASHSLKHYEQSLQYYELGEQLAQSNNNEFWVGNFRGNKANSLLQLGQFERALVYALEDLEKSKKNKVWGSAGGACTVLAELYLRKGEIDKAARYIDSTKYYLDKSYLSSPRFKRFELKVLDVQIQYYKRTNQKDNLIKVYEEYLALKDSLSIETEQKNLARIKAQFDLSQKENEITLLVKNSEIQEEKIKIQRTLIYSSVLVLLLLISLAGSLLLAYRRKSLNVKTILKQSKEIEDQKEELEAQGIKLQESYQLVQTINEQLEEKVNERTEQLQKAFDDLDFFLYRSSHDTRRPISTLLGLEQLLRIPNSPEEHNLVLNKIHETILSMDGMLSKLQMVYNLNKTDEEITEINILDFINECTDKFISQQKDSNFIISLEISRQIKLVTSASLLRILFNNLIENAYYFRRPTIEGQYNLLVRINEENGSLNIAFNDTGIGIDHEIIPNIFDIYFRGTELSKGNGLGLYLVKKSVEKMGGTIEVISEPGVGSQFIIRLPNDVMKR